MVRGFLGVRELAGVKEGGGVPSDELGFCDASESAAGGVFEVAGGHGRTAPGCMKDFAEFGGCLWGHAFALDAFVKECVNADAARVRDGAGDATGVRLEPVVFWPAGSASDLGSRVPGCCYGSLLAFRSAGESRCVTGPGVVAGRSAPNTRGFRCLTGCG